MRCFWMISRLSWVISEQWHKVKGFDAGVSIAVQCANRAGILMNEKALSRCALFLGLTPDELTYVAGKGKQYWVSENHTFFEMGDLNESMFVVVSGSVHIERPGTKVDKKLRTLNPGALFGEISFMDGSKTVSRVSSAEPTEVLELDSTHFSQILTDRPELASKLWRNLGFEPKFLRRFETSAS